uniref:Arabinogalactan peptide 22 n=1 Tax=Leersia perrieri TaxID=77586 RepID=A0A0D9V2H0_9ORYZ
MAASLKVYLMLFIAFFLSGLMQLSMAQGAATATAAAPARLIDAKAIDQAIAYLLMFAALFVTYFSH